MENVGAMVGTFVEIGGRYYEVLRVHQRTVRLRELDGVRSAILHGELEARKVRL